MTMTEQEQRIAIAEWYGISPVILSFDEAINRTASGYYVILSAKGEVVSTNLPNYLNDLNAIHEAEEKLTNEQFYDVYCRYLSDIAGGSISPGKYSTTFMEHTRNYVSAKASQRAEALLKTIGKWVES